MGFSKKNQADGDSKDGKRWMIAGITLHAPLKPVCAKNSNGDDGDGTESGSTTPTSSGLRVVECPPPPRKLRPVSTCHVNGGGGRNREFYTSPDIDSFFKVVLNSGRAN
ncbi:hypothetical protein L1987_52335 [Smallanthus sonchifolius]|uniref:Uncharacterized protein n=1 Tax=Smallanthus sonchifolius TaxID=185202 RepID=A0ACB9ESU7_9ASTR|nr:hypothetical protein L1987_52335 [Smallanthus sonchifolius]